MVFYMESAENLLPGSLVYLRGVPAGYIDSLRYLPEHWEKRWGVKSINTFERGPGALAVVSLSRSILFYDNYSISTRNLTLFSGKVVEINPGNATGPRFPNLLETPFYSRSEIDLIRDGDFSPFHRRVIPDAINDDDVLYLIASTIKENRLAIRRIFRNVALVSDKLNHSSGDVALLLNDRRMFGKLEMTLGELLGTVKDVQEAMEAYRESDSLENVITVILGLVLRLL